MSNDMMLHRLRDTIRTMPTTPVGEHLTEEVCAAYVTDQLLAEEIERIDTHLLSCSECASMVATIATRVHLAAQLTRVVVFTRVALRRGRAATLELEDGETDDGTFHWRIVEDSAGNLKIRFGAHAMELLDEMLTVTAGDWQREEVLSQVAPDQVGAEWILTVDERASLSDDAELCIRSRIEGIGLRQDTNKSVEFRFGSLDELLAMPDEWERRPEPWKRLTGGNTLFRALHQAVQSRAPYDWAHFHNIVERWKIEYIEFQPDKETLSAQWDIVRRLLWCAEQAATHPSISRNEIDGVRFALTNLPEFIRDNETWSWGCIRTLLEEGS